MATKRKRPQLISTVFVVRWRRRTSVFEWNEANLATIETVRRGIKRNEIVMTTLRGILALRLSSLLRPCRDSGTRQ